MSDDLAFRQTETERRLTNMIVPGVIAAADYAKARVRVRAGDTLTDWLPWMTPRAGGDVSWWAPEVGEQVLVFSPAGEPGQGWVQAAAFSDAAPPPADRETLRVEKFADNAFWKYDREAHRLHIKVGTSELIMTENSLTLRADTININDDR